MSLLTALIVKNVHILAGIYFAFLKNVLDQTWKVFNTKLGPQWKDWESSHQVKQILALFCKLVIWILGSNCVKGLRNTEIVKVIEFGRVSGKLIAKELFPETIVLKIFEINSSFHVKYRLMGNVKFRFFLVLTKCSFWG